LVLGTSQPYEDDGAIEYFELYTNTTTTISTILQYYYNTTTTTTTTGACYCYDGLPITIIVSTYSTQQPYTQHTMI